MTRVEITECGRTVAGDVVAFTIEWDGDPAGEVEWVVRISSPDQSEAVELGCLPWGHVVLRWCRDERVRAVLVVGAGSSDAVAAGQVGLPRDAGTR